MSHDATRRPGSGQGAGDSRRRFVKKAAYLTPLLLTLPTTLSAAQVGSAPSCNPWGEPIIDPTWPDCDS